MKASVLDLRKNMGEVLAAIERREHVTLTHRGKCKAIIIPAASENKNRLKVTDLPAFGMWRERDDFADVEKTVRKMREPRRF
jgi:antitoxin (DNA-binding transcriptional repressor) of toxin-antitoxin stability system